MSSNVYLLPQHHGKYISIRQSNSTKNIKKLRGEKNLTQSQLADKIGVTHQQLQKYEKGTNRISAGRLSAIAKALNKPVSYFFEGSEDDGNDTLPSQHQRMCIEVSRNFLRIKNPMHQNAINLLVRTLSED